MRCDLVRTSALALAFVGSIGLAAAQQQPPPNASPPANAVLVNGAFAVPGAPANTDTVPAKFSAKNAADDKLIIIAYTFKTLSDEERRAIYQALKGQPTAAFNADVGTELPPPQNERARNHEGVSQSRTLAHRHIEKSVAKIGPLGSVLAAERGMVSVRRGDHKRIGSGEARDENAGIAGPDDHDFVSHPRPVQTLRQFPRRRRRASSPSRDREAIGRAVGGEDEK